MGKKYLLMTFLVAIIGFCGTSLSAQNVAKVGNTEYATIDDAIANWTNNTTLTLLTDVTLSDVIELSSTEYHILDLGNYTMTAASKKDAIQIVNNGRSSASYALDIKADATNAGGIKATGKAVVRTAGKSGVKDRPIIRFYNGVFDGSYIVYHSGSNGTNCPQFQFHGGVFNGTIYTNRTLNQFYGGNFNGSLMMSVDSSAYTLIAGGTFKQLSNLYNSSLNSNKFTIGSAKGAYNKEVYVDDNGYYVVAAAEPSEGIEAAVAKSPGTNDYLAYSKVGTEGKLNYTDVETALKNNTSATVTVYVDELDMEGINFKGTIVVPADSKLTITNAPATLVVKDEEGNVLEANANGSYTTIVPDYSGEGTETSPYIIASIDDLSKLRDKVNGGETYEGVYFKLTSDITLTGEWTPIGNGSRSSSTYTGNAFKGVFDGNEKTIDGLNIANGSSDETKGLFGVVDGGTVKNLKLTNVNISTSSKNVGGAAGLMVNNATIDKVEVYGTLTAPDGVGGIVGRMIIDGTISNCTNNATVTATTAAGGIVGKAYYSALNKTMNITGCTNKGNITGSYAAGGIAALSAANISNCSNTAVIASNEAGGIVGEQIMYGTINNNINSGLIKNINNDGFAHGGIIGWVRYHESTTNYPLNGIINVTNNTNTANIEATGAAGGSGGIVGHIYNQANVTGNTNKAEHIYGGAFAAGIAGSLQQATGNLDIENTTITVSNNISLTSIENITVAGLCKDLFAYNNDAANFVVKDNSANPPVAKIGETKYATLEAAFAAATEGQTITLLADATPTLTSQRAITKAAVIDLGDKTLTLTEDDLYFGTTTFQNGNIVVDPSVKPSTAVFWMFANQTLTFDNVKIVATGVTGTYLIGLDGNNSDLNIINGSEIIIENTTALDLDVICVNASTGNDIVVEDSKVNVTNLDGRVFFRGNYTVKDSEVNLDGITKAGFRIEAGQTLSIEGTSVVNITGEPRDGGIHLTDITSTYTKAETATVNATVNEPKVAKVGENTYRTFAEAAAAAQAGSEIILLANIEGDITVPANVTLNGNGFAISGAITADGTITFAGVTKAGNFGVKNINTVVNIPAGASLQLTGTGRMVIGHGCTFNITGSIADEAAKTANVADLTPSLIMPGASFTGAGVTFNVTDAYIQAPSSYCSSSKSASGTFAFKFENSIWESAGKLAFESQSTAAKVDFALVNSVLTTGSHLVFGTASGEEGVVIDNSNVNVGTSRQIENRGTMTIKNGAVVNGAVATSSNAKNPGTIIVENATYAVTGEFSGSDLGTGTLIVKKGANVSVGSIKAGANVTVDAEGMAAGDEINFTADLSQFTGTLSVINNDNLEAKIVDGKVVLAAKPAAKIGETPYTTLEAAFKAATSGCTIDILSDVTVDYNWDARYTGGKFTVPVTINGNDKTIKFTASVNDNNYQAPFRFEADATVKDLIIDMSEVTDNRFRAISSKGNLTVDGCKFIGKDETLNCRAVIFGEGAGTNVGNLVISITNSEFINWKRGITDNENAQDVKTVTITGNTLTDAGVGVSAKETVTFTGNTVAGAYVNIKSYTAGNKLAVTATGNTLEANTENAYNVIDAGGVVNAEGFKVVAKGNDFTGYTRGDAIWGEVWGNARESFVIKVLDANGNVMGTTSLNNVNGIIDGDVNVTWSLKLDAASNTDEYWTMAWTTAPTIDNMPAKVELWVDGVKVSGGNVVLNGPDEIAKIYAAVTDASGKILGYHTDIQEAIKAAAAVTGVARTATAGTVEFLSDVTVDKWIMFAEKLTIGDGSLITLNINGVTIDGNGKNLTVKSIESAGNGNRLFYDAQNLTVKDLTINIADGLVGGIGLQSGTISNVTFNGGQYGVLPGKNGVTVSGCTFNDTKGYAVYYEDARPDIVVTGNTFNTADGAYAITMRSNEQFTNNTINTGKVNLANSAASTVSGNDFGNERFKVYNGATATISDNKINNLVFSETNVPTESTFTDNILSTEAQAAIDALPVMAGDGTEANPYTIGNLAQLKAFRDDVNAGNNYQGKYVALADDIDLNNEEWTPIGNNTNQFKGYFDGNEKTISNLKISGSNRYVGLFGYIKGQGMSASTTPSVKDLTLENVNVSGDYYVGGLSGQAYTCNITNVTVKGEVSGVRYVGGLVGHVYTYFKDCHFIGNASCSFDALGGIAGAGDCRAYDCSVIGNITGSNWVGGIVGNGQEGTSAVGCYVKGDVKTSEGYYRGVGGIAGVAGHGYSSSEFKNNYFDGEVYLEGEKVPAMIIGIVNANDNESIETTVEGNSWNTEHYDAETPVYVTAEVTNDDTTEEWIDGASEELTKPRNNNLVMLESDIQYVEATDINDVTIMKFSKVTEDKILPQIVENNQVAYIDSNADGAYTEGETKYTSLAEAYTAATDGQTITLLNNITLSEKFVIAKSITLDGNGKTLTYTGSDRAIDIYNASNDVENVTIKDLTVVATTANRGLNYNENGKFNVEGVTVTIGENVDGYAINFPGMADNAQVTIKNSKLTSRNPLNIWGENMVIDVYDSEIISVDNSTTYDYAAIQLNNEIPTVGPNGAIANGTVVNVYGGTITALNDEDEPSNVVANATETGVVNISDETVVTGKVLDYVANIGGAYFGSLQAAVNAIEKQGYNSPIVIMKSFATSETATVKNGLNVTIDLNGKTITVTDNTTKNFEAIKNQGTLTIKDSSADKTGKITVTATTNSGWNRYSAVIANTVGGKLTVNGGTIEHLGGTDMAYGIDNLTNGKGTYAETIINGGTIKSTYRAIRQFLNGVEAQNILTVNGGTIEGANKSIWMQDPSKNANTGTLAVGENAQLKGDVYLYVTAGSTSWPVEVSIADAALQGESTVMTGNVPAGYELELSNGIYCVTYVVATIDVNRYETLQAAITAAGTAETTINVIANTTENITIQEGANITLEFDEDITLNGYFAPFRGNLTINGGTINNTNSGASAIEINDGVLNLNNVNIASARHAVRIDGAVTATINGGEYTLTATSGTRHAVNVSGGAEVTIEAGTFVGPKGTTMDSGAAVCVQAGATVTIEGGDFSGGKNHTLSADGNLIVTGGTFDQDPSAYLAQGYITKYNETTSRYEVFKGVAKIENEYFASIQDAIDAAENNDVITVISDFEMDITSGVTNSSGHYVLTNVANKAVVIDLNGKKVTVDVTNLPEGCKDNMLMSVFCADTDGNLTLKDSSNGNGSVSVTGGESKTVYSLVIAYGGLVNIEGGNYSVDYMPAGRGMIYGNVSDHSGADGSNVSKGVNISGGNFTLGNVGTLANGSPWILATAGSNTGKYIFVTGGTYNADILHQHWIFEVVAPTNKALKNNGNGTYTIVDAVAFVKHHEYDGYYSEIGYATLEEAFEIAETGDVVTLVTNVELENSITVNAGKEIILDLNGKTISGVCNSGQGHMFMVQNTADLTVKDSSENEEGKITYSRGTSNTGWVIDLEGDLILESGTIELTGDSWSIGYVVDVRPNSWGSEYTEATTFTMSGGKLVSTDAAVRVASSSADNHKNVSANFIMNGGEIEAARDGIFVQQSNAAYDILNVRINGGNIKSALSPLRLYGPAATSVLNNVENPITLNITGGTFDYTGNDLGNEKWLVRGVIMVSGGATFEQMLEYTDFEITGGTFEGDVNAYCAEGFAATNNDNGTWTVMPAQEQSLVKGWNWYSSYIDINGVQGLEKIENALGTNGIQILGHEGFIYYDSEKGWYGPLVQTGLDVKKMYKIEVGEGGVDMRIAGNIVDFTNETIEIKNGFNWISYPFNQPMNLNDALEGFTPAEGDYIVSHFSFAFYYDNQWQGPLESFTPGEGYIYERIDVDTELSYNVSNTRGAVKANVTTDGNKWMPNGRLYPNNMTMIAVVDGLANANYEVAAFVNGELRGSARPIYIESLDAYMLFLTIHGGDEVEEMSFRLYDIDNNTEYDLSDRINYSNNAHLGSVNEPYVFSRGTTGIGEASMSNVNIYPNPTTTGTEINLEATCDKVEVFNALGVKVAEYQNVDTIDALETAGIYVIRITNNGNVQNCRLVVK